MPYNWFTALIEATLYQRWAFRRIDLKRSGGFESVLNAHETYCGSQVYIALTRWSGFKNVLAHRIYSLYKSPQLNGNQTLRDYRLGTDSKVSQGLDFCKRFVLTFISIGSDPVET